MMKQVEAHRNRMLVAWYDAGSDYTAETRKRVDACRDPKCRGECGDVFTEVRRLAWDIRHAPVYDPAAVARADGERRA